MAGSVDEYNLSIVLFDVVSANVLRNAAGFAPRYIGLTNGVEQRSLSVIDVTHDRDHGGAPYKIFRLLGQFDVLRAFLFVADLVSGSAEIARQILGQFYVESLIDGGKDFSLDQLFYD